MHEPSREESAYATIARFLRRYSIYIAMLAPFALISVIPMGQAGVLVVVLIYLGEAIVYAATERRRQGTRRGPGPALQALWGVLAILLVIGGLAVFGGSGDPA